ncbi:MAG: hypothetical protein NT176_20180 [Proteobacteria bacterium]|nr:hypothetical protein [Pseudomonadota bacterium]
MATWAVAAAGLCLLAWDFRFRLDLTDEAFSIQDALFPDDQLSAVRFHWIVTRPLLLAVGGDIYLFRLAGAMMLMAAGALLGSGLSRLALRGHRNRAVSWTLSGLGATLALGHYGFDLRSPGYNWLITLLSVMVAASIVHSAVNARGILWAAHRGFGGRSRCLSPAASLTVRDPARASVGRRGDVRNCRRRPGDAHVGQSLGFGGKWVQGAQAPHHL